MKNHKELKKIILITLGVATGLALEILAVFIFLESEGGPSGLKILLLLALHIAASALLAVALYALSRHLRMLSPKNWLILSFAGSLVFPLAGYFCMVGVFLVYVESPFERTDIYEEYSKYIGYDFEPEKKYMESDKLFEGIAQELDVVPIVEVMAEENMAGRRGIINAISKLPKKDAVKLLKMALADKSIEVRYSAASELSRLEAEFNENIFMARKEVARQPDSSDAHLGLANAYSEYYESALLDEYAGRYYIGLAVKEYEKALELGGENIHILNYLGNLELAAKDYKAALAKFRRVVEIDPANVYANVGLINVHFEAGRIGEVVQYAREVMPKMRDSKGLMREIISMWAS